MANIWVNIKDCINIFFLSSLMFFKRHLKLYKAITAALYFGFYDIYTCDICGNNNTQKDEVNGALLKQNFYILPELNQNQTKVYHQNLRYILLSLEQPLQKQLLRKELKKI